jgi:hypothetical protein
MIKLITWIGQQPHIYYPAITLFIIIIILLATKNSKKELKQLQKSQKESGKYFILWKLPKDPSDGKELEKFFGFDKNLTEIEGADTLEKAIKIVDSIMENEKEGEKPVGYEIFESIYSRLDVLATYEKV